MSDHCSACCPNKKQEKPHERIFRLIEESGITAVVSVVVVLILKYFGL